MRTETSLMARLRAIGDFAKLAEPDSPYLATMNAASYLFLGLSGLLSDRRQRQTGWKRILLVTGRVDDVINVSGHRLGTAEIESALVLHDAVAEAAVVGYPHDIKGQGIYAMSHS